MFMGPAPRNWLLQNGTALPKKDCKALSKKPTNRPKVTQHIQHPSTVKFLKQQSLKNCVPCLEISVKDQDGNGDERGNNDEGSNGSSCGDYYDEQMMTKLIIKMALMMIM